MRLDRRGARCCVAVSAKSPVPPPVRRGRVGWGQYRGYLLIEVLVTIGLLSIVALLAARVFWDANRVARQALRQHADEAMLDQLLQRLRQDVWSASTLESGNEHELVVRQAAGAEVKWHAKPRITRGQLVSESSRAQSWDLPQIQLTFTVRGPTVLLRIDQGPREYPGEIVMVSQGMLLSRRTP